MKKENNKKTIFVLTNGKKDELYSDNKVFAVGTKDELERFKKQLADNGYNNNYTIEERECEAWASFIRYRGYYLKEHNGLLYTEQNISLANEKVSIKLTNLANTYNNLKELKDTAKSEEKLHFDIVMKIVKDNFDNIRNEKLNIKMI